MPTMPAAPPHTLIRWSHRVEPGLTLRGWRSPPSGKPLLHFVHGNGFCGLSYWAMLRRLSGHYDLFLSDVQGHGDSDAGNQFDGWQLSVQRLFAVIERFAPEWGEVPVQGVGHSFGGVLTLLLAALHPQLFSSIVVLDPVLFPPELMQAEIESRQRGESPMARDARLRTALWPSRAAAWRHLHQRGGYKGWSDEAFACFIDHALYADDDGQYRLKCPPQIEAAIYSSVPLDYWRLIPQIDCPGAILHGDSTMPFMAPAVARALQLNPGLQAEQVTGGHCFMQEQPAATAERVAQWLQRLAPSAVDCAATVRQALHTP